MTLRIDPITPTVGARVYVSPDHVLDEGVPEQLLAALEQYGVLVLPENGMSDEVFTALTDRMGPAHDLGVTAEEGTEETKAGVYRIALDKDDPMQLDFVRGNDWWHMDGTVYDTPGKATLLKCEQPPSSGGDTGFAMLDAAWNALPAERREMLDGLTVRHAFRAVGKKLYGDYSDEQAAAWDAFFPPIEHPLVWHRKDGTTSMMIGVTAYDIPEMDRAEAEALLDDLYQFATQDRFSYRHKWKKGDVVIFHNPAMLHRSYPYDKDSGRLMHRTTIAGTEAVV